MRKILFVDIDGVLAVTANYSKKKRTGILNTYEFDKACVRILNQIVTDTDSYIVLSSDWRDTYNLTEMNNIFQYNKIESPIIDFTPCLWGTRFFEYSSLHECRAEEILQYVKDNNIENYMVVDDLDLGKWFDDEHYVRCKLSNEGLKQLSIKEKIIKRFNRGE